MKVLVEFVLFALVGFGSCADTCYDSVVVACKHDEKEHLPNCDAKYGGFEGIENRLQKYANMHIGQSFDYLLLSTHFGHFEKQRHGFEKLYRKLSDSTWNDAIELIKYIAKRGGAMDFNAVKDTNDNAEGARQSKTYELSELASLGRALEAQKAIAREGFDIHKEASHNRKHDPAVASHLENDFVDKHADTIRELSGHTNDLKRMIKDSNQASLSLYLFDEYLQKL